MARTEQEAGLGIRFVVEDGVHSFEVYDVPTFERALGTALVVAFSRAFVAADRLATVGDLMALNARQLPAIDGYEGSEHDPSSVSGVRNLEHLTAWQWGLLYEVGEAISALEAADARNMLTAPFAPYWQRLVDLRARWNQRARRDLRNKLHGHVGDAATHARGLAASQDKTLPLLMRQQFKRIHTRFALGPFLLSRGIDPTMSDVAWHEVAVDGRDDHYLVGEAVMMLFVGVLQTKGAYLAPMLARP